VDVADSRSLGFSALEQGPCVESRLGAAMAIHNPLFHAPFGAMRVRPVGASTLAHVTAPAMLIGLWIRGRLHLPPR
jgi:hypothetical protein